MKEFEHIRYKIYLALLNKISGTVGEEKKELIYDLEIIKNGLIPLKYIIKQPKSKRLD